MDNYDLENLMQQILNGSKKLVRHFKGGYYYIISVSLFECDQNIAQTDVMPIGTQIVSYTNVCHPEFGVFSRPLYDMFAVWDNKSNNAIMNREDNITGQIHRFEIVNDLDFQIKDVETADLLHELLSRPESPISESDLFGGSDKVATRDYVTAYEFEAHDGKMLVETVAHINRELAEKYQQTHFNRNGQFPSLFKRIFIKLD